jgi:hypothetical protein
MSQTSQQQQGAVPAEPGPRKDWELFWRIIAVLMIVVIGWIVWVLYQITPRSIATPLAYQSQATRSATQQSEAGVAAAKSAAQEGVAALPAPQPAPEVAAAALLMDQTQAALRAGAHQASADVQAANAEQWVAPVQGERLKLSTEITTPLVERRSAPKLQETRPDGAPSVPAATDQAGKVRP